MRAIIARPNRADWRNSSELSLALSFGMSERSPAPFQIIANGFGYLRRHPEWALAIAGITALLSALGPLLQIKLGLPNDVITEFALKAVCVLPLELYFVPRLLMQLDAETLNRPENPEKQWRQNFEERWLKAFGARIVLYLFFMAGIAFFVIPGMVVLILFGWMPLRVLVRGEAIPQAARSSASLMTKAWPQVLRGTMAILALFFLLSLGVGWGLHRVIPEPTAWQRLTHPILWVAHALSGALELLLSACFLALYHAVEPPIQSS
ncbi:MAG: hypothetical protein Q8O00_02915 [Holophaga sp.]|nr:hypothetical protein [Holophaga sp.]